VAVTRLLTARILVCALVLALAPAALAPRARAAAAPRKAHEVRATYDVRYFPGRDRQLLDVFAPRDARGAPVVLFVHGGTWMGGDKDFHGLYRGVGTFLAKNGIVAVLINYRLSPKVRHPEHVKDVARAFAWTRRNIRSYGGDPDRIILCGHSAGGHLVSLLATDPTYLKDPALKLKDADRAALRGVASFSGVYRIPAPDEFKKMAGHILDGLAARAAGKGMRASVLIPALRWASPSLNPFNVVFGPRREVQLRASPLSHVRKGLPPFLVVNAEREVPGLADMARDFAAALRKKGNTVEARTIPGSVHRNILFHLSEADDPSAKALLDFVAKYTKPAKKPDPSKREPTGLPPSTLLPAEF
jgi:acetyl esterase/lipase